MSDLSAIYELLKDYNHHRPTMRPNYMRIPVTYLRAIDDNREPWNKIYQALRAADLPKIRRTRSGGIGCNLEDCRPSWDVRQTTSCVELTIWIPEGLWRIQYRATAAGDDGTGKYTHVAVPGHVAALIFRRIAEKHGIDMANYAIDNGAEIKATIPAPLITLVLPEAQDLTLEHCCHADYHSAYGGGLADTHPEFRPVIEELYDNRADHPEYKNVITNTIGFWQSTSCCGARWAHLTRDAMTRNREKLLALSLALRKAGRVPVLFNTDGCWYIGDPYHGEGEGTRPGQWENDHTDCKLRIKSAGCYEYIENGKYTPVVRGATNLDQIKTRDHWEWGDIYKAVEKVYAFNEEEGIINV